MYKKLYHGKTVYKSGNELLGQLYYLSQTKKIIKMDVGSYGRKPKK